MKYNINILIISRPRWHQDFFSLIQDRTDEFLSDYASKMIENDISLSDVGIKIENDNIKSLSYVYHMHNKGWLPCTNFGVVHC